MRHKRSIEMRKRIRRIGKYEELRYQKGILAHWKILGKPEIKSGYDVSGYGCVVLLTGRRGGL